MPNWNELLGELKAAGSTHDVIRRKYLAELHKLTGRNVIIYYSGWLQKRDLAGVEINDADKNGFMTVIHQLDRASGLDLVLHTPGGDTAATESLVDYLRAMFGTDIRAIVPQLAMSGGTMIACACKEIIMGKHSSLGPIDPQFGGIPAHGIVEEFNRAKLEVRAGLNVTPLENEDQLQEAVLSVHHSCIHTLGSTSAFKIVENHEGVAFIQIAHNVLVQAN